VTGKLKPIAIMKTKPAASAAILALILSVASVPGQAVSPTTGAPGGPPMQAFDPTTGMPIAAQPPQWIDSNWKDPDIVLTNVAYDNLPVSEVARDLRNRFKEQFDIILPDIYFTDTTGNSSPVDSVQMQLRMKDVKASELFIAMNLIFENDRIPLRWDLQVVGHRQIALLRVLEPPHISPPAPSPPAPPPEPLRRIYFVGDLVGDEKSGGMGMEQIVKTITDVWQMADTGGNIQFHKEAQLLIVSGSPSQIDFAEQTLVALRDRQRHAQEKAKSDDSKASSAMKK
jgi:hypothetical protein